MKKHLIAGLLAVMVILASCKKDNNKDTVAAEIQGTYKLKYITAKTNSTVTVTDGEKAVTTSDYTTINNQGTIVFDDANLTATGLAYGVDTEAKAYLYQDNQLIDSFSSPLTFTLPASTSMGSYRLVGTDSIYFPEGSLTSGVDGTGSIQSLASGGRYSFSGKLLTITQMVSRDSSYEDSGETVHVSESAVSSAVMEKQ